MAVNGATRQRVLIALNDLTRQYGYPPTLREIGSTVGINSPSAVLYQVKQLETDGLVLRLRDRRRVLCVTTAGLAAVEHGQWPERAQPPKPARQPKPARPAKPVRATQLAFPTASARLSTSRHCGLPSSPHGAHHYRLGSSRFVCPGGDQT